jgi:ankyrin repeat protein
LLRLQSVAMQLYIAADQGHLACCELLLSRGRADVNAACFNGWTPLMTACDEGHSDVVRLLFAHKADLGMRLEDGRTAYSFAESLPSDHEIKQLLT